MIDNLDEAIQHCIEIAEAEENKYSYFMESAKSDAMREEEAKCKECANEHRQLAKWLKELEAYIKIISELSEALHFYDGCEKCQGFREYPTSDFVDDVRSWVKQFEEVSADV